MLHIIGVKICSLYSKISCKPYANVLKADRLSSVRWKDILHVHYKDRVTVAAYHFDCNVNLKRCLIFSTLFEGSAVGVPSLHRFHLQCNYSIFSLLLHVHACRRCVDGVSFAVLSDALSASRFLG